MRLERVNGIEPSSSAWKAVALPLSYTREIAASVGGHSPRCAAAPALKIARMSCSRWSALLSQPARLRKHTDRKAAFAPDFARQLHVMDEA